jgi:hypothetical protein
MLVSLPTLAEHSRKANLGFNNRIPWLYSPIIAGTSASVVTTETGGRAEKGPGANEATLIGGMQSSLNTTKLPGPSNPVWARVGTLTKHTSRRLLQE